ncbi:hypothetical protein ACU4GR_16965 [Methylobacterium oryzae CBMB20]
MIKATRNSAENRSSSVISHAQMPSVAASRCCATLSEMLGAGDPDPVGQRRAHPCWSRDSWAWIG